MPRSVKISLLSAVLIAFLAGSTAARSQLVGDLDGNYSVDFKDLRTFALQWLASDSDCFVSGCIADLDGVDGVNMADFALLAKSWQIEEPHIVISEFMASNASSPPLEDGELLDGDGESSDWIEIYNPTDTVVNLDGWYLTNNDSNLTKWQFPAVELEPGEFLVVFASGKNRLDPNELHTSFNLDKDGAYLALVAADGSTVAHEYVPEYPEQVTDVSYGLAQYATTLMPTGATASYYVPTSGDLALGTDWTALDFNDSAWDMGPTGLGFGNVSTGFNVTYYKANTTVGSLSTAEAVISGPSMQTTVVTEMAPVINYNNTNTPGHFGSDNPFPSTTIGSGVDDFVIEATCIVQIPEAGDWTFGVHSDDGFGLELTNGTDVFTSSHPDPRGPGDTLAVFNVTEPGPYDLRLVFYERGGGSGVELFAAKGSFGTFSSSFHLVGDTASGGLHVSSLSTEVDTDVQQQMQNINTSLWARIEFILEEGEVGIFDTLTLRMKYEDGFVAYLNGCEVARRNAPNSVEWNSTAESDRPIEDASVFEEINVMAFLHVLRSGRNVLAIHGLNDNENDGDFLILPELVAARNRAVPQYFTTATPGTFNIPGAINHVGEVWFSSKRTIYAGPPDWHIGLTLSTGTDGAEIRYTDDGSRPTMTHGSTYDPETGVPLEIGKTTVIRAVAVKPGWLDSDVETHTYIFPYDVIAQSRQQALDAGFPSSWGGTTADYEMDPCVVDNPLYSGTIKDDLKSIPTMSLVMDLDDLFSSVSGIYANPGKHGVAWERPGSIELIYPDGSEGFQVNCGVRIYGGAFRGMGLTRKKTFRLLFKGMYGQTKLRYPLFGEDAVDEFDTIILRGGANDAWNNWGKANTQYIVDEFMRRTQLALGHPSPHGTFVHLYVNGLYWGLYNPVERPQSSFAANYFGGTKEEWDTNNSGNPCGDSSTGTWNAMFNLVGQGLTSTEAYQKIQGNDPNGTNNPAYDDLLDVDNYIAYMFSNFWGGTGDWPHHNYYAGCRRPPNATGFKFFNWDSEGAIIVWSSLTTNRTGVSGGAGGPYAALRQNSEFCLLFADHAQRHLFNNGPATSEPSYARYKELADEVERAIVCESARWGDMASSAPYTLSHWQTKRDYVLSTYMPQRPDIVLDQLRDAGLYSNIDAPVFYINGEYQHGGEISAGDKLTMDNPNGSGTIYYTTDGSDPRLPENLQITSTTLLVAEDKPKKVLVPTGLVSDNWKSDPAFNDSGWNDGTSIPGKTGGVGYEANTGYEPYISYDVKAKMYNGNNSCYIRIPFTFNGDPGEFNFMTLKIRYDDGFVAYLNGDANEIERKNFTGTPYWNSNASGGHEASGLESIPVSDGLNSLKHGDNILAIHGLNISNTSTDFLISVELVAGEANSTGGISPGASEYTNKPVKLDKSTHVKARVLDGITWSALNEAIFAIGPVADYLRITEIMYHPQYTGDPNDPNEEFIELINTGPDILNLNLVRFTEGIHFTFPDVELAAGEHVVVVKDRNAFEAQYGTAVNIAEGQYTGSLANDGERIKLEDAIGRTILDFEYKDGWRSITDGDGFSLTIIEPTNGDLSSWGEKDFWRASVYRNGSPGWDDSGIVPTPGAVVINEVMSHSNLAPDWIELHNTTDESIDISGWYLSDDDKDDANLMKYRIADETEIASHNYIVFYQDANFGTLNDAGCIVPFALSENGEEVCLSSAQGGVLTGYREVENFGAAQSNVSFGRYFKSSTGNFNFVAMDSNTLGGPNAYPKVGPIVINEIMYNPPTGNQNEEYIELYNITPESVILYRLEKGTPWRFTDGIEYTFPAGPPVMIPADGYLLLVKDKAAFTAKYGIVPSLVQVFGDYDGRLSNAGERLQIGMPGDIDEFGTRCYIRIDRVNYSDGSHPEDCPGGVDLWPTEADGYGYGFSLTRKVPTDYGNDVANWKAATPSPGAVNP